MLNQLERYLEKRYVVISISFESADDLFASRISFVKGLLKKIGDELIRQNIDDNIVCVIQEKIDEEFHHIPIRSCSLAISAKRGNINSILPYPTDFISPLVINICFYNAFAT